MGKYSYLMKFHHKSKNCLLILFALSALTHFAYFGYPAQTVFDEVYFGRFASDYITGDYYFDQHPPLGKLIISGFGHLSGISSDGTDYSKIGDAYSNKLYLWYRFLPTLAGTLLPLVVFLLTLRLKFSRGVSFLAGLLIVFENSLLVQSRMISLDSMLLLFGFSSLWLYLSHRQSRGRLKIAYLVASAITAALAFNMKWTGLSFLGLILLTELWTAATTIVGIRRALKGAFLKAALYLSVGLAIYAAGFAIHFALLPHSGQGDAFMTPSFQKTLAGNQYAGDSNIKPLGLFGKFLELNKEMYEANATMNATHPYSSKWYTWPTMARPIYYWEGNNSGDPSTPHSYIYYLGNPVIYWSGGAVTLGLILYWLWMTASRRSSAFSDDDWRRLSFIVVGFLANFLPFVLIGRVMFLYHYEAALAFSVFAIAFFLDSFGPKIKKVAIVVIISSAFAAFLYFSPLTYGTPLSDLALNQRMWFSNWR